ncbi:multidrug efflux SMR transporter [Lentzea tibetensis]|uniref:Multidrug efflux SMR transporter n=1 Tax=Lentzea tibetensis TaxID=2591470 RepID=A0A563EZL6_9PSEU|nr:multidrug efflux SMR transporter [Lentzea tibetensis]
MWWASFGVRDVVQREITPHYRRVTTWTWPVSCGNLWNNSSSCFGSRRGEVVLYLVLAVAIAGEIAATVSLKLSEGFTKLWPSVVVVAGYAIAFTMLSKALKMGMPIGVAYAIWSAVGVAAVAIIGWRFLGENLNPTMIVGLVLVVAGVVTLELGRMH